VEKLLKVQGSANIISSDMSPRFNADGVTITMPKAAIASGAFNRVPVLKGSNQFEGRFITALLFDLGGKQLTDELYALALEEKFGAADAKKVLAQYPPSKYPSLTEALAAVYGDSSYSCPTYSDIRELEKQDIPVYSYEFREPNPPSVIPLPLGPTHVTELAFVFQAPEGRMAAERLNPKQLKLSDQMISYWTNFARNGDPNGESLPRWTRYSTASDNFLGLTSEESGLQDYHAFKVDHHCGFWEALGI
jgi:para-nitrobenzyl esterase